jgi:hypothetical protein
MLIKDLLVLQAGLRHTNDIWTMANYVKNGGFWNQSYLDNYAKEKGLVKSSPLISISQFEDGLMYVHDGNHRAVSVFLGGRKYLREDEYILSNWKYSQYLEIAPENGWFTPFDPRVHVRTPDFAAFKEEVKLRFNHNPTAALQWLNNNFDKYRTERIVHTISDLAENFGFSRH